VNDAEVDCLITPERDDVQRMQPGDTDSTHHENDDRRDTQQIGVDCIEVVVKEILQHNKLIGIDQAQGEIRQAAKQGSQNDANQQHQQQTSSRVREQEPEQEQRETHHGRNVQHEEHDGVSCNDGQASEQEQSRLSSDRPMGSPK